MSPSTLPLAENAAHVAAAQAELRFRPALSCQDYAGAFGLLYDAYLRSGLTRPNAHRIRVTPYHLLDTTEVFVAEIREELISTISLVRDGELGVPMEAIYGEEVAALREAGFDLAEVSCLADRRGRRQSTATVFGIMSIMAQCAAERGVDYLLIAVHPRHAGFYQRFIGFELIGRLKAYGAVQDNPAVALALDLNHLATNHPKAYRTFFGKRFPDASLKYQPMPESMHRLVQSILESEERAPECLPALGELQCA